MHRVPLAFAAALLLAPVAHAEPERAYQITIQVTEDGEVVAAPSIRLAVGGSARMQVNDCYRINATVTEAADGKMQLETEIARPNGVEWVVEARPRITVNPDGEAMMMTRSDQWDEIRVSIRPAA